MAGALAGLPVPVLPSCLVLHTPYFRSPGANGACRGSVPCGRGRPAEERMKLPPGRLAPTLALLVTALVSAMDDTIISTVMPTIVGELGGLALYSWAFAGYLLTSTTTVPIYGRLADIYGRKP